ncbi:MAG: TIGR04423 family type III CRISPR-associated protein [Paludibacteraceae bacterium]|nr:TIGR04423 family type III CRISPR-associated protein [Paludibacteraceae bacterium]
MNRVSNIKPGNYVGYFWKSDAKDPQIVKGAFTEDLNPSKNPFIVEAQLYDHDTMLSYSIKYVDGEYMILEHQVLSTDFNRLDVEIKDFYAHRIDGHKKLQFLQYWKENENGDSLCEDMQVLRPAEFVFVGFND